MRLLDIKLKFEHEGKIYTLSPDPSHYNLVEVNSDDPLVKTTEKVSSVLKDLGFTNYVDCTLVNTMMGGLPSITIGKALERLGYDKVFRKKKSGVYRYYRYNSMCNSREDIEALL